MNSSTDFRINSVLLTIGTIINKGLQFAVIPFFSKWLSTEEYGQFDLILTYVSLLLPIITLSSHEGIFRMCVGEENEKKRQGYITCGFIIDITNFIILNTIIYYVFGRNNGVIYIAFSLYLLGEVALVYLRGVLRAMKKLEIYSFVLIFSTVLMIVFVSIFVLVLKMGLTGIIAGYAIGSVLGAVFVAIWIKLWRWIQFSSVEKLSFTDILSYSVPLIPNDLSWWVINASDRQIINIFFGNTANGIYAIAHKVPAICSIIFGMVSISWQQEISLSIEERREVDINGYLNPLIQILSCFCSILLSGSFVLYCVIFDRKYYDARKYSPILIVSSFVLALSLFFGGILAGYKRTKSNGVSTIIGATVNIIIHISLINVIGLYAAAISTLISNIATLMIRLYALKDVYSVKLSEKTMIAIAIMCYFLIISYFDRNMVINALHVILAMAIGYILNKELIADTYRDLKKKRT